MDTTAPTFAPGAVIGEKYRLDRELGRGGMGAVYAATNLVLDVPVAIKVLHVGANSALHHARRFLQEARAAAAVRHANIVRIVDFGQDAATGVLYLVQEFLPGRDLKAALRARGPMAPAEAIELLLPVMRALAWAHAKNIVHRDLKPDNIFLEETPDGVVPKVIDFGIAKVTDAEGQSAQNTATAQLLGTPFYMSPEQARGDRAVDQRTDVWALGVVLFHMVTGRHPHEGATPNLVMASIITRPPRPAADFAPALPGAVTALLDGALRYEAAERYPTMDAFGSAARACLASLGVGALAAAPVAPTMPLPAPRAAAPPATLPVVDVPTVAPHVTMVDPLERTPPARAPHTRAAGVGVLAGLALVTAVGVYWAGRERPPVGGTPAPAAALARPLRTPPALAPPAAPVPTVAPPPTAPAPAVAPVPTAPAPAVAPAPPAPASTSAASASSSSAAATHLPPPRERRRVPRNPPRAASPGAAWPQPAHANEEPLIAY